MSSPQNTYTGDNSSTSFSFAFDYLNTSDVKASLDGTLTTDFTLTDQKQLTFNTAPATGVVIRIFRDTENDSLSSEFSPGSAIKASDLNTNFKQGLFVAQETTMSADAATATANTATTTANTATATANQASTDASNAVSTANQASTDATNAVSTANTASTNASNAVSTANSASSNATSAVTTANQASTDATSAVSTANTALTNASSAVTTANQASTDASSAVSTANTAATNASNAVTTANTASTNASNAVTTANQAFTDATNAVTTANQASTDASSAVTTANTAATNASAAVTTANTAATDASNAVTTANTASTDASSAVTTANTASTNASSALTAVNNADFYTVVANVTALLALSPSNGNRFEVTDSTGAESQSSITGLPANFIGSSSINLRVEFNNSNFEFLHYFARDPDSRYVSTTGNAATATKLQTARNINGTSFDGTSNIVIGNVPQNSQTSSYTLVAGDAGHHVNITSGDVTVPQGVFSVGDVISIYNGSSTTSDILAATGVDLYFAGTSLTGTRTLQSRGIATILCVATDDFVVCGVGIS